MTYEQTIEYIQKHLKKDTLSYYNYSIDVMADRELFMSYYKGNISLVDTLIEFKKNNDMDEMIQLPHFKKWLESLGYIRNEPSAFDW